ncbi:MAG: restriction endonuclease subunit S [Bacteroidales bacterium]|nr:restriction endonuclease subunit S [Bacteroidales bacterium]
MNYQVPQHISKDKIFIINRSTIDNRLDAQYYSADLDLSGFVKLSSVTIVKGGKRIPKGYGYSNEQTPYHYLRVADMDSDAQVEVNNLMNISEEVFNILERYEILEGELAISIAGTIGKTTILKNIPIDKRVILTENCAKILAKTNVDLLPKYLKICLDLPIVKKQLDLNYIQTTIPKLGLDKIVGIKIPPIPCIQKQQEIVDYINEAYIQKRAKETEAQQLLDSIDDYLLKELGINIPEVKANIGNRIFIVQRSELKGRYTPCLYKDSISLYSTIYENIPLSHLAYINPNTRISSLNNEMPISFVPMESVNEIYAEINDNKNCIVAESKGFTRFQEGDLLWAKITPCMENGKSAVAKDLINGYGCGSTEFHVIRPKNNDLLVEYIHTLLHMKIVRQTAKLYFGGSAGQQRVASDFLESFNVPLPSETKQQDIVDYITNIRTRAKALQAEGKAILENAKRKVEQMIIGE